jgi:hypothetical protein
LHCLNGILLSNCNLTLNSRETTMTTRLPHSVKVIFFCCSLYTYFYLYFKALLMLFRDCLFVCFATFFFFLLLHVCFSISVKMHLYIIITLFFFFWLVLGFEFKPLHLLSRCSTIWITPSAH